VIDNDAISMSNKEVVGVFCPHLCFFSCVRGTSSLSKFNLDFPFPFDKMAGTLYNLELVCRAWLIEMDDFVENWGEKDITGTLEEFWLE
jgi:hypothetical protein